MENENVVELRVVSKAKNAILARFADDCGGVKYAAEKLGVSSATFSSWLNFRSSLGVAKTDRTRARSIALTLERETGRNIRDIFPLTKAEMRLLESPRVRDAEIPREALLEYAERTAERLEYKETANTWELRADLQRAVKTLRWREKIVIELRFGLGDGYTYSYKEIAAVLKCTQARVRHYEMRALHTLKHPSRSLKLLGHLDD